MISGQEKPNILYLQNESFMKLSPMDQTLILLLIDQ